jgi:hypothetical protein
MGVSRPAAGARPGVRRLWSELVHGRRAEQQFAKLEQRVRFAQRARLAQPEAQRTEPEAQQPEQERRPEPQHATAPLHQTHPETEERLVEQIPGQERFTFDP